MKYLKTSILSLVLVWLSFAAFTTVDRNHDTIEDDTDLTVHPTDVSAPASLGGRTTNIARFMTNAVDYYAIAMGDGDIEYSDGLTCEDVLRFEGGLVRDDKGRWLQPKLGPIGPAQLRFAPLTESLYVDDAERECHLWEMKCRAIPCGTTDQNGDCVAWGPPNTDYCSCEVQR